MGNIDFHLPEDFPDEVEFNGYEDIARVHGRRALLYERFGDWQGEWMMLARDDYEYVLYRDWFGSCSGCDAYEGEFGSSGLYPRERVESFCANYRPFALIPVQTAINLVQAETLETVFPANFRSDLPLDQWVTECSLIVKLEESLSLHRDDAFLTQNMETRRRIIEQIGIAKYVDGVIQVDGQDKLITIDFQGEPGRYLWLKDSSTEREYLLRVPPEMTSVRAAKAWSFGLESPNHYRPLIET